MVSGQEFAQLVASSADNCFCSKRSATCYVFVFSVSLFFCPTDTYYSLNTYKERFNLNITEPKSSFLSIRKNEVFSFKLTAETTFVEV